MADEMQTGQPDRPPLLSRIVATLMRGDVAISLMIVSFVLGGFALVMTPREEDPQIAVPMADLIVRAPGLTPEEVENQITSRLERIIYQVEGVEHVYSRAAFGSSITTVRFFVGQDRERALVRLQNELDFFQDRIPPQVTSWLIRPRDIDDVPILVATLWSAQPDRYHDVELRRMAEELVQRLSAIRNTNQVQVIGGRPLRLRVDLLPSNLAGHGTSAAFVVEAVRSANIRMRAGNGQENDEQFWVELDGFVDSPKTVEELIVATHQDRPVYLREVANVTLRPADVEQYTWIGFGPGDDSGGGDQTSRGRDRDGPQTQAFPAVHIAAAKRPGANNVWVADEIKKELKRVADDFLPDGVGYRITRNYGQTANDKVNRLVQSLAVAIVSVLLLLGTVVGWRAALVIAIAVPVCYSLTLFINYLIGYSINRVTMFALILALGLIVDDPITDVENIARYLRESRLPTRPAILQAVQEVRPALIISTLTVVVAFLPLNFITGMMGPYMAPMSANVPIAVTVSTVVVSFMLTPWLCSVVIGRGRDSGRQDEKDTLPANDGRASEGERPDVKGKAVYRFYRRLLGPIVARRWLSWLVLAGVVFLFFLSLVPPVLRFVGVKMLPYDNNDEFQVIIDMPEPTTLERTDAAARKVGAYLSTIKEVEDYSIFVGTPSPVDFNGLVRRYYLREGSHMASLRINLIPQEYRTQQSHELLLRLRPDIRRLSEELGANIKLVEVPPGPPVISTITGVIHGPPTADYEQLIDASEVVRTRLEQEPGVVDVDVSAQAVQSRWVFKPERQKARLAGIGEEAIGRTIQLALRGNREQVYHRPREVNPTRIEFRLPRPERTSISQLRQLLIASPNGQIPLTELGRFEKLREPQSRRRRDLELVAYVFAEVAGRPPGDAIMDIQSDQEETPAKTRGHGDGNNGPDESESIPLDERTWLQPGGGQHWSLAKGFQVEWAEEGEWEITLQVFRDLGLAYAAALTGIFAILMFQTGSRFIPLVIMTAIPLTLIGIMPGFWLLNALTATEIGGFRNPTFFTATSMIGMIVLSGVVIRNSVLLIDFIQEATKAGAGPQEAIIQSVAVRTRPILLTAATTLVGNLFITLDPIFSGLAWAIIFGVITSNLFTLLVVPVIYGLLIKASSPQAKGA